MGGATKFDTSFQVETPENIDLTGIVAGPVPRICAYAIDLAIRSIVLFVIIIIALFMGKSGFGLFLVASFLMEWFYPIFFEVFKRGQTPGKKIMGLVVVNENQTPVSFNASFVRNLMRAADFLPFLNMAGIITMSLNKKFRRLGDIAAGTIVIYADKENQILSLPDVTTKMPPIPLSLDDQVALINFTQRHSQLSEQRKIELANILEPITDKKNLDGVKFLQGVGCWLLGDKR